jgi:hypothetical protein
LINEIHSFGQIFSGCFYDTVVNIFNTTGTSTAAGLLTAAQTAGQLLLQAVQEAPQKARLFREVGRAMLLADQQKNKGKNEAAIRTAFEGHGIPLSLGVALNPEMALSGAAPTLGAKPFLAASVKKDLMDRLGAIPGSRTVFNSLEIGKAKVGEFVHRRAVALSQLDKRLKDVVAMAPESVLLGDSGGRAAVLGMLPHAEGTQDEVETFVRSLLRKGAIDFGDMPKPKAKGLVTTDAQVPVAPVTHKIKVVGGMKTLVRIRFACGCGCAGC